MSNANSFCDTENVHVPFTLGVGILFCQTTPTLHNTRTPLNSGTSHKLWCIHSMCKFRSPLCCCYLPPPSFPSHARWPSCGRRRHQSGRGRKGCHSRAPVSCHRPSVRRSGLYVLAVKLPRSWLITRISWPGSYRIPFPRLHCSPMSPLFLQLASSF